MSQIDLNNVYLLLERSNHNLNFTKESNGDIVLEGIFAEFGVENNNERIYEENEYLPHLEYLNKYIEQKRLLGQLDHPVDDVAQISLSKSSHIIESLKYDKDKRQLVGRIRLLDTPNGKIAKSLIEQGIPLSISSRAVGSVDQKTKKASILRIFTYDLVANPGFENATLKRVNEDLGIKSENLGVYELTESARHSLLKSIDFTEKILKNEKEININKKNQDNMKEKIEKINENFESLKDKVDSIESIRSDVSRHEEDINNIVDVLDKLEKVINEIIDYLKENEEEFEKIKPVGSVTTDVKIKDNVKQPTEDYLKDIEDVLEKLALKVNSIESTLKDFNPSFDTGFVKGDKITTKYIEEMEDVLEKLALKVNSIESSLKDIKHSSNNGSIKGDNVATKYIEEMEDVLEKLALKVNSIESTLKDSNYIKNNVSIKNDSNVERRFEEIEDILEKLALKVKGFKSSNDSFKDDNSVSGYLDEMEDVLYNVLVSIKKDISYLKEENEVLKQQNKDLVDFQEYLVNAITKLSGNVTDVSSEKGTKKIKPNEGIVEENENEDEEKHEKIEEDESYENIINKTDKLIALIEKKEKEAINESEKYPFVGLLNEDTKLTFRSLNESKKQRVAELVKESGVFTEEGVKTVIQNVLNEDKKEDVPNYLKFAGKEHLKLYESLNEEEKLQIARLAKLYEGRLQTEYQVKSFWDSQIVSRFKKEKEKENKVLLESKKLDENIYPNGVINLIKRIE
jgi:hypothetical protein